jgi:hypothetical protein
VQEALGDQRSDTVEDAHPILASRAADDLRRLEREAANEE